MVPSIIVTDNDMKLSPFWKKPDFEHLETVYVTRLGPSHGDARYKGIVKGYYACDVDGHPDAYIIEMIDTIPPSKEPKPAELMSCFVFPRGCVDSAFDLDLKDESRLTHGPDS